MFISPNAIAEKEKSMNVPFIWSKLLEIPPFSFEKKNQSTTISNCFNIDICFVLFKSLNLQKADRTYKKRMTLPFVVCDVEVPLLEVVSHVGERGVHQAEAGDVDVVVLVRSQV